MSAFAATTIANGLTGNVNSSVATRDTREAVLVPSSLVITSTIGATPTVTVNIKGSPDGVNFFNIPYALVGTPSTFVLTAITITTAVTTTYLLQAGQPWQFLRVDHTANTNVTLAETAYL